MMANLDADELVSVKENIAELEDKINSPDQCVYLSHGYDNLYENVFNEEI